MYLSFEEYRELGGSSDIPNFPLLEYKAEKIIDSYTFSRLKQFELQPQDTITAVKMCMTELINTLLVKDSDRLSSWSGTGVSVSYQQMTDSDFDNRIRDVIHTYLINCIDRNSVRLMFCGGIAT